MDRNYKELADQLVDKTLKPCNSFKLENAVKELAEFLAFTEITVKPKEECVCNVSVVGEKLDREFRYSEFIASAIVAMRMENYSLQDSYDFVKYMTAEYKKTVYM